MPGAARPFSVTPLPEDGADDAGDEAGSDEDTAVVEAGAGLAGGVQAGEVLVVLVVGGGAT